MKVLYPPNLPKFNKGQYYFLAGSIDMGKAVNWQERLIKDLDQFDGTLLNPRRSDFDPTLKQTLDEPKFVEQVEWELACLEQCKKVFIYFDPAGKAPVTMLELGRFYEKVAALCCPPGFWRSGNVEIFANRYNVPFCTNYDDFVEQILDVI